MTCKTLQGKYAEKLENQIEEIKKCLKKYKHTNIEDYSKIMEFYKELCKILGVKNEQRN